MKKFLLIDSKATRRHSIQNMFFELGYDARHIDGVASAEHGIQLVKERSHIAGFIAAAEAYNWVDLLSEIREIKDYNEFPIIVLSDAPTQEKVISAYENGANGFLAYPCPVENIEKVIKLIESPVHPSSTQKRKITVF